MENYANKGGDAGIEAYEIGKDNIRVKFKDGSVYLYNYTSPGKSDVDKMIELAREGQGLNSYISSYVKKRYASKER